MRQARAEQRARRGRRAGRAFLAPFLWIVTAGVPNRILAGLRLARAPGWPRGVYFFGDEILRVGLVVASELPRERSTLLVRLMAAGPLLTPAIAELRSLPPDAPERAVAEGILVRLQHALRKKPVRNRNEKEFIVKMYKSWEDGKDEARIETQADAVLTVLRVRGVPVPVAVRKRILAEKDLKQLKSWLARAVIATSIEDVIGARSRRRSVPPAPTARARAR